MFFSSFQNCGNTWKKDTGLERFVTHLVLFFYRLAVLFPRRCIFFKVFFLLFLFFFKFGLITLKIGSMCSGIFRPKQNCSGIRVKKIAPEYSGIHYSGGLIISVYKWNEKIWNSFQNFFGGLWILVQSLQSIGVNIEL